MADDLVVVERTYESIEDKHIKIAVFTPKPTGLGNGSYSCKCTIEVDDAQITRHVEGVDALHAFFMALLAIDMIIDGGKLVDRSKVKWSGSDTWGSLGLRTIEV